MELKEGKYKSASWGRGQGGLGCIKAVASKIMVGDWRQRRELTRKLSSGNLKRIFFQNFFNVTSVSLKIGGYFFPVDIFTTFFFLFPL